MTGEHNQPRVAQDHEWRLSFASRRYIRSHFGIVRKSYREQWEYAEHDGTTTLGHRVARGPVAGAVNG